MSDFAKALLVRFAKGGIFSAISAMLVIIPVGIKTFHDLAAWLVSLVLVGIVGFITGGLMAAEKGYNWQEAPQDPPQA